MEGVGVVQTMGVARLADYLVSELAQPDVSH